MSNKVLTVLAKIGQAFKAGLDAALQAEPLIQPFVAALNPSAGAALATTVAVVAQTEQKFTAMGEQSGSGAKKLAEATAILQPLLAVALADAGNPASLQKIQGYIAAVVAILNQPAT
jgi:hypothetical protein